MFGPGPTWYKGDWRKIWQRGQGTEAVHCALGILIREPKHIHLETKPFPECSVRSTVLSMLSLSSWNIMFKRLNGQQCS